MSDVPAIRAIDLTKFYGRRRGVEGVTFAVQPGEVVGFLGPNGSGKTTVLRMLMGLISITRGTAELFGRSVADADPSVRRDIGYLPGTLGVYDKMTAREYFRFLARIRGRDCTASFESLSERLSLDPSLHIGSMSKGTKQKVGVIQAFMHSPRLLILDEPTSGLDPLIQHEFDDLLAETREQGTAVLLSSHILSEVERLASRVAILNNGTLIVFDDVEALPGHETHSIVLEFASPVDSSRFAHVSGFTMTSCDENRLEGTMTGSQRPLLETALQEDLVAVQSPEPSLDELFRQLVDDSTRANHRQSAPVMK